MTFKQSPPGFLNVNGPLIEAVQAKLNAAGFNAGTEDGIWGKNTVNALLAWKAAQGLPQDPVIDDATWNALFNTPSPALSKRSLQLTGAWEGTGYGGANGNFDGQGITWGVVGFTWGNGELQNILEEIHSSFPAIFSAAFGDREANILNVLDEPLAAQMTWARGISTNGGNYIVEPWSTAFKTLGAAPEVQEIEDEHARHYWDAGMVFAGDFGLQSESGLALCFDIAVQDTVTDKMIASIQQQTAGMAEVDKMRIIAHVIADNANPKYYEDVLKRKMIFVTGQGPVHGDLYDITCWGIG